MVYVPRCSKLGSLLQLCKYTIHSIHHSDITKNLLKVGAELSPQKDPGISCMATTMHYKKVFISVMDGD